MDPYEPKSILFSDLLVKSLRDWSRPVRVRIVERDGDLVMEFQRVEEEEGEEG